jgi:hypothetical protein
MHVLNAEKCSSLRNRQWAGPVGFGREIIGNSNHSQVAATATRSIKLILIETRLDDLAISAWKAAAAYERLSEAVHTVDGIVSSTVP